MEKYFEKLVSEFVLVKCINKEPFIVEELFGDETTYNDIFNSLYGEILKDYDYRLNKVYLNLQGHDFSLYVNSLIVHMILWKPFLKFNHVEINTKYVIDTSSMNNDIIAEYLDMVIDDFITEENQLELNDSVGNIIEELRGISLDFNSIIGNTINLYDKIQLAKQCPEYNDLIHTKLDEENMSMVEIENEMKERTSRLYDILENNDNCFRDYIASHEGINKDQLCQFEVVIGPKPDIKGNVFPKIINSNFLVGGLQSASDYFIDASGGRKASIINFSQVKISGYLTRKLSLLCMNTVLDPQIDDCGSTNYMKVFIENKKILQRLNGRYAVNENNEEILIRTSNKELIGQTINLRSPITCCSHNGKICRKCYGELSKINDNIHVGILGCEFLTEQQTQKMLSAKHLLKTNSEEIKWQDEFLEFFNVSSNSIGLNPSLANHQQYSIVFNEEDFNESGDSEFSRSINKFTILTKGTNPILIETEKELYISEYMDELINFKGTKDDDGNITLGIKDINDEETIFFIEIENNELSKHLHAILNLIDQKDHLGLTTKDDVLQKFYELVNEAGIHIDSVHLENILREILRNPNNLTKRPDWSTQEPEYVILRVTDAIMQSDSITTSLSFENVKKQFYDPTTYNKVAPSFLDNLFK